MTTFNHLLVTTDFSPEAEAGIRTGRDLAAQLSARVSLVHVCDGIFPSLRFSTEAQRDEIRQQALLAPRAALEADRKVGGRRQSSQLRGRR